MAKEYKAMTVRIETDVHERAVELFDALGTDLTSAIRMFVNMSVMEGGFPFTPRIPTEVPNLGMETGSPSPRP